MTLVDNVKSLCAERSMTLASLERALNLGNGTLSRWDRNSPSAEKVQKVADYFAVSTDYLLGRENPQDSSGLDGVYLSIAKDAMENGLDPEDIKLAIKMVKKLRQK